MVDLRLPKFVRNTRSAVHSLPVHLKSGDLTHIQRVRHTDSHIECTYLYAYWGATAAAAISVDHMTPPTRQPHVRTCLTEFQTHLISRALLLNPLVLILTQVLGGTRYTTVVQGVCRAVCWLTLSRRLQYSNGVVALASVRTQCWKDTSISGHVASDGVPG